MPGGDRARRAGAAGCPAPASATSWLPVSELLSVIGGSALGLHDFLRHGELDALRLRVLDHRDEGVDGLRQVGLEQQVHDGVDVAGLDRGEDLVVAAGLGDAGDVLAGGLEGADGAERALVVLGVDGGDVRVALERGADVGLRGGAVADRDGGDDLGVGGTRGERLLDGALELLLAGGAGGGLGEEDLGLAVVPLVDAVGELLAGGGALGLVVDGRERETRDRGPPGRSPRGCR